MNAGALADVLTLLTEKDLPDDVRGLVEKKDFSKLYAHTLEGISDLGWENLQNTDGIWKKYEKDSEPDELVSSLQGFPLEWCTRNRETANNQLKGGDFYVYYSQDLEGKNRVPRLAIRMKNEEIAEVRGIMPDQEIDEYIHPILDEKMSEFGIKGDVYLKKSEDMKRVTEIKRKVETKDLLSMNELIFIYEIYEDIEGFGYNRDPRIEFVIESRDVKSDFFAIFKVPPEGIEISVGNQFSSRSAKSSARIFLGNEFVEDEVRFVSSDNILAQKLAKIPYLHENLGKMLEYFSELSVDTLNVLIAHNPSEDLFKSIVFNLPNFSYLSSKNILSLIEIMDHNGPANETLGSVIRKLPDNKDLIIEFLKRCSTFSKRIFFKSGIPQGFSYRDLLGDEDSANILIIVKKYFENISEVELADLLITSGFEDVVFDRINDFSPDDNFVIAHKLIDSGFALDFFAPLQLNKFKFPANKETLIILERLLKYLLVENKLDVLAKNIYMFDTKVFLSKNSEFVEVGYKEFLVDSIERFSHSNLELLAYNVEKIHPSLHPALVQRLKYLYLEDAISANLDKFQLPEEE